LKRFGKSQARKSEIRLEKKTKKNYAKQGINCDEHEYRLTKYLLSNYESTVRPVKNSSEPIEVWFGLSVHHIIDVDEKNQILTVNCWVTQSWTDTHLTWNASDFGDIGVVFIPHDKIWKPDIILYNNADSSYSTAVINTNVIVQSNGNVVWLSHGIYKCSCNISVEYFPFDIQECKMKWASWTYDSQALEMYATDVEGDLSNYQENGEFKLESFTAKKTCTIYSCCPVPIPDITYTIVLRRRPMFYVFNLILPCVLINGIALLVFYVPSESGEKVTLGISALLSMTVFLMTIRESLPPTEKTPLISMYYGVSICLVSFASAMAVVTLNIHYRGLRGSKVPPLTRLIVLGYLAKLVFLKFEDEEEEVLGQGEKSNNLAMEDNKCLSKTGKTEIQPQPNRLFSLTATSTTTAPTSTAGRNQDYQINGMDTTVPPTQHQQNHDPTNMEKCEMPNTVNVTDNNVNGGGRATADVMDQENSVEHVANNSLRRRRNLHGDFQYCNGPRHVSSMTAMRPIYSPQPMATANHVPLVATTSMEAILLRLSSSIDKLEQRFVDTDSNTHAELEWKKVALVVDRLCLLIFFLAMTIASLAILTSSPHLYTPSLSDLRRAGYGINDTAAKSTSDTIISDNHKHYEPRLPSCNVLEHVLKTGG